MPFVAGLVIGLLIGVAFGLLLDRYVLRPLVIWHARWARHGSR
jgi:F0F1-type ATP synthase assembly protein I